MTKRHMYPIETRLPLAASQATKQKEIFAQIRGIHDTHQLGLDHSPFGTDKLLYKSYLEYLYPRLLAAIPQIKSIVEVGVRGGASLYLWSQLFPQARITGIDIIDKGQEAGPNPDFMAPDNIIFIKGDAYTNEVAALVPANIDLFIDDGSHYLRDQIRVASLYLDKLSENGHLVIEDIQRGFRDAYKIMRQIQCNDFNVRACDFRYHRNAYDDFAVCISRGKTRIDYQLYLAVRAKVFLVEHLFIKITNLLSASWKRWGRKEGLA